jgi:hypothetical protein
MNCPKCGEKMRIEDKICRLCRYMPEADRVVVIEPPRARRPRTRTAIGLYRRLRMGRPPKERKPLSPKVRGLAGLLPGLGHLVGGDWLPAIGYAVGVVGIFTLGAMLGDPLGPMLFGVACAVHAYSIVDLLPGYREQRMSRLAAIGLILLILNLTVYTPLSRRLAIGQEQVMVNQNHATFYQLFSTAGVIVMSLVIFAVLGALSAFLGGVLSQGRHHDSPSGNDAADEAGTTRRRSL